MGKVIAVMGNGTVRWTLHPDCGETPGEVVEKLVSKTLTGSAAPFAASKVWLPTTDGGLVDYALVEGLERG